MHGGRRGVPQTLHGVSYCSLLLLGLEVASATRRPPDFEQISCIDYEVGKLIVWGDSGWGGYVPTSTADLLYNVVQVKATTGAFAVLRADGRIFVWGDRMFGGAPETAQAQELALSSFTSIAATRAAFAAVRAEGSVIVWGDSFEGGQIARPTLQRISGHVRDLYANEHAFAALLDDSSLVVWGAASSGGRLPEHPGTKDGALQNVTAVASTWGAFAALRQDGSVVAWGQFAVGGDTSHVASDVSSGVQRLFATNSAFAALKVDGSVVAWGDACCGADAGPAQTALSSGILNIASTGFAFAALKDDYSVVAWGNDGRGADTSALEGRLVASIHKRSVGTFRAVLRDGSEVHWGDTSNSSVYTTGRGATLDIVETTRASAALVTSRPDCGPANTSVLASTTPASTTIITTTTASTNTSTTTTVSTTANTTTTTNASVAPTSTATWTNTTTATATEMEMRTSTEEPAPEDANATTTVTAVSTAANTTTLGATTEDRGTTTTSTATMASIGTTVTTTHITTTSVTTRPAAAANTTAIPTSSTATNIAGASTTSRPNSTMTTTFAITSASTTKRATSWAANDTTTEAIAAGSTSSAVDSSVPTSTQIMRTTWSASTPRQTGLTIVTFVALEVGHDVQVQLLRGDESVSEVFADSFAAALNIEARDDTRVVLMSASGVGTSTGAENADNVVRARRLAQIVLEFAITTSSLQVASNVAVALSSDRDLGNNYVSKLSVASTAKDMQWDVFSASVIEWSSSTGGPASQGTSTVTQSSRSSSTTTTTATTTTTTSTTSRVITICDYLPVNGCDDPLCIIVDGVCVTRPNTTAVPSSGTIFISSTRSPPPEVGEGPPQWAVGAWGSCDATCGEGHVHRDVACEAQIDVAVCDDAWKPAQQLPCEAATGCEVFGVAGGAFLLCIALCIGRVILWRRRKKQRTREMNAKAESSSRQQVRGDTGGGVVTFLEHHSEEPDSSSLEFQRSGVLSAAHPSLRKRVDAKCDPCPASGISSFSEAVDERSGSGGSGSGLSGSPSHLEDDALYDARHRKRRALDGSGLPGTFAGYQARRAIEQDAAGQNRTGELEFDDVPDGLSVTDGSSSDPSHSIHDIEINFVDPSRLDPLLDDPERERRHFDHRLPQSHWHAGVGDGRGKEESASRPAPNRGPCPRLPDEDSDSDCLVDPEPVPSAVPDAMLHSRRAAPGLRRTASGAATQPPEDPAAAHSMKPLSAGRRAEEFLGNWSAKPDGPPCEAQDTMSWDEVPDNLSVPNDASDNDSVPGLPDDDPCRMGGHETVPGLPEDDPCRMGGQVHLDDDGWRASEWMYGQRGQNGQGGQHWSATPYQDGRSLSSSERWFHGGDAQLAPHAYVPTSPTDGNNLSFDQVPESLSLPPDDATSQSSQSSLRENEISI